MKSLKDELTSALRRLLNKKALLCCSAPMLIAFPCAATQASIRSEKKAIFAPVASLFEGISSKNDALIKNALKGEGTATLFRDGRFLRMSLGDLGQRLTAIVGSEDQLSEKMDAPLVRVDGNIAVVWGSYEAYKNGKLDHRGSNLFSLIKEGGSWHIVSIVDTSR